MGTGGFRYIPPPWRPCDATVSTLTAPFPRRTTQTQGCTLRDPQSCALGGIFPRPPSMLKGASPAQVFPARTRPRYTGDQVFCGLELTFCNSFSYPVRYLELLGSSS